MSNFYRKWMSEFPVGLQILIIITLIGNFILLGVNVCFTYPTAEEMNIQIERLYENISNLIGKKEVAKYRVTPLYKLVDGQYLETAWEQTIDNLKELNYVLEKVNNEQWQW